MIRNVIMSVHFCMTEFTETTEILVSVVPLVAAKVMYIEQTTTLAKLYAAFLASEVPKRPELDRRLAPTSRVTSRQICRLDILSL